MLDWTALASITLTMAVLLWIRQWTARRTRLRAGSILLLIGLPALLTVRAIGEADIIQSEALIWPMILLPVSVVALSLALLVRGGVGVILNRLRQRRLTRDAQS